MNFSMLPLVLVVAGFGGGYIVGGVAGERRAPESVQYQINRDRILDEQFALVAAEPSRREQVCETIFEIVIEEYDRDLFDEQEDRSTLPDAN